MGASTSTISSVQGLNLANAIPTSGSDFMSANNLVQASMTNNPLISLARNQSVSQLNSIGQAIQRSLFELGTGSSGSNPTDEKSKLVNEYKVLLVEVQKYTAVAPSLELDKLNTKLAEMRGKMIDLDKRKGVLVSGNSSVLREGVGAMNYYLVLILYICGPIFATVILLNVLCLSPSPRVPESTLGFYVYNFFYVFLAYLFYPLVLLYGGINPPIFSAWFPIWATETMGSFFYYKKPDPATDNPMRLERGRIFLRFISLLLFITFLYTFVFFDDISPLSQ